MISTELARKIRILQITTRKVVNDVLAGEYTSVFKGRGMEFDEVREYMPGDDVRTIDWNVTARMDRPYVKRFVEERELTVFFLVDLSASGARDPSGSASSSPRWASIRSRLRRIGTTCRGSCSSSGPGSGDTDYSRFRGLTNVYLQYIHILWTFLIS